MKSEKSKSFNSKILLFGEYSLIVGSMALSIPYEKYHGKLLFDESAHNKVSKHYSAKYLIEYLDFLSKSGFEKQIRLIDFKHDIQHGLIFETNIPISYGLGSSGAIVASIYDAYSINPTTELENLKSIFSRMESYYHGKSSGLDPLVSYLNQAVLINENGELNVVSLAGENNLSSSRIFLIDTETVGETQPLVKWFIKECENDSFKNKISSALIPANNSCINSFLSTDFNSLHNDVKSISRFTYDNLKPMIPDSVMDVWEKGLETDNYYLKLCGSGGGGMMLGFTKKANLVLDDLADFKIQFL